MCVRRVLESVVGHIEYLPYQWNQIGMFREPSNNLRDRSVRISVRDGVFRLWRWVHPTSIYTLLKRSSEKSIFSRFACPLLLPTTFNHTPPRQRPSQTPRLFSQSSAKKIGLRPASRFRVRGGAFRFWVALAGEDDLVITWLEAETEKTAAHHRGAAIPAGISTVAIISVPPEPIELDRVNGKLCRSREPLIL